MHNYLGTQKLILSFKSRYIFINKSSHFTSHNIRTTKTKCNHYRCTFSTFHLIRKISKNIPTQYNKDKKKKIFFLNEIFKNVYLYWLIHVRNEPFFLHSPLYLLHICITLRNVQYNQ